ncbi:MAG: class II aldolase/adducin family protein, partial [Dongiaceae bacterium]
MCEIGRRAYARGLIAGGEGNFSCLLEAGRVLCTPSGACKGSLEPHD